MTMCSSIVSCRRRHGLVVFFMVQPHGAFLTHKPGEIHEFSTTMYIPKVGIYV